MTPEDILNKLFFILQVGENDDIIEKAKEVMEDAWKYNDLNK